MNRSTLFVLLATVVAVAVWLTLKSTPGTRPSQPSGVDAQASAVQVPVAAVQEVAQTVMPPPGESAPLIGERILAGYANPSLPPEHDLTVMSRLMDNFLLLVKDARDRPLSANEEWAAALRGVNPAHERFLPDGHIALNRKGQLIDRWQTPLFIHALGAQRFELRSAGPDQTLWTEDDLHLNADGSFRQGEELTTPTLFEPAARTR